MEMVETRVKDPSRDVLLVSVHLVINISQHMRDHSEESIM